MHWMIEPEAFPNENYYLKVLLEDLGVLHTVCKLGVPYEHYTDRLRDPNTVFHGSKQFAEIAKQRSNWRVFWNTPQYECHYYYPRFGEHLINHRWYTMLPYGDLVDANIDMLFPQLLVEGKLFVKSDDFKGFSGTIVSKETWAKDMRNIGCYADPETIAVVAAPVEIHAEYRCVVANGQLATASEYKPKRSNNVPHEALQYARSVLKSVKFNPDPIWMLDIANTNLGWKVLEVGPFSCCALYECDAEVVISVVQEIIKGDVG